MKRMRFALRISEDQSSERSREVGSRRVFQPAQKNSSILHSLITPSRMPLFLAFLFFIAISFLTPSASGQSTSASLTGLIDDPSRAVIVGAQVTAINTETGVKTTTTSNREGQYVLPNLQPGSYRLEVDKPGFKGIIEAGLTLHVQDVVQINKTQWSVTSGQ